MVAGPFCRITAPFSGGFLVLVIVILSGMTVSCSVDMSCHAGDASCRPESAVPLFHDSQAISVLALASASCANRSFCLIYTTVDIPLVSGFVGISGADAACANDTNRPSSVVQVRAFLVSSGTRVASVTPDVGDGQLDWVLLANKQYRRADGVTVIGTTGANRLLQLNLNAGFTFAGDTLHLTGMQAGWTSPVGGDCGGWNGGGTNAGVGFGDPLDASSYFGGTLACTSGPIKLRCVEQ